MWEKITHRQVLVMAGTFRLPIDCASGPSSSSWDETASRIVPDVSERAWLARPEALLWLHVVADARDTAARIGRGANLPGRCSARGAWLSRYRADAVRLEEWLVGDYPGSLEWITTHLAGVSGLSHDDGAAWAEGVRVFCRTVMSARLKTHGARRRRGGDPHEQIQAQGQGEAERRPLLTTTVRRVRSGSPAAP